MNLGKVTGQVVATHKDEGLEGFKLLIVQYVRPDDLKPREDYVVAVDTAGAGAGEIVLVVAGSSARFADGLRDRPVDAAIVGIVDSVETGGSVTYNKAEAAVRG